jgi:hypothetical protein
MSENEEEKKEEKEKVIKLTEDQKIEELKKKYCNLLNKPEISKYARDQFKGFINHFFTKLTRDEDDTVESKYTIRKIIDKQIQDQIIEFTNTYFKDYILYYYIIGLFENSTSIKEELTPIINELFDSDLTSEDELYLKIMNNLRDSLDVEDDKISIVGGNPILSKFTELAEKGTDLAKKGIDTVKKRQNKLMKLYQQLQIQYNQRLGHQKRIQNQMTNPLQKLHQ